MSRQCSGQARLGQRAGLMLVSDRAGSMVVKAAEFTGCTGMGAGSAVLAVQQQVGAGSRDTAAGLGQPPPLPRFS